MRLLLLLALSGQLAFAQFVTLGGNGQPGGSSCTPGNLPEQWLMHDGSGSTFADATCNANTITASNITWGTGTGVTSPAFNGTNSSAVAAQTTITNFDGTKPFSVSVWVNPSATPNSAALAGTIVPGSNYMGWEIGTTVSSSINPQFYLINSYPSNAIAVESTQAFTIGSTANLIVTYDGSQNASGVAMYINGVEVPGYAIGENSLTSSAASGIPLNVGARSNGSMYFTGSMSNLQIFSGVLSSGQIAAIQTAGP